MTGKTMTGKIWRVTLYTFGSSEFDCIRNSLNALFYFTHWSPINCNTKKEFLILVKKGVTKVTPWVFSDIYRCELKEHNLPHCKLR